MDLLDSTVQAPAVCPLHAEARAVFSCSRCGTFGCERCASPRAVALCVACAERDAAPVPLIAKDILRECFDFLAEHPGLLLACVAAQAGYGLVMLPFSYPLVNEVEHRDAAIAMASLLHLFLYRSASFVFLSAFSVVVTRSIGERLRVGGKPWGGTLQNALGPGQRTNFLLLLATLLGGLLFVVPGVLLAVGLSLALPLVVFEGRGAMDALFESWERTRGQRGQLALVLFVCALACAGSFLAGLGLLFALARTMDDRALRVGLVVYEAVTGMGLPLLLTALVVCYQRVSRRQTESV